MLPPTAVADFMIPLAWSAASRPAHEGRSAFAKAGGGTRIGERLTERPFSLYGDPSEFGIECAPFVATAMSQDEISVFDNGAPIGRTALLADGVISGLLQTRASAAGVRRGVHSGGGQPGADRRETRPGPPPISSPASSAAC